MSVGGKGGRFERKNTQGRGGQGPGQLVTKEGFGKMSVKGGTSCRLIPSNRGSGARCERLSRGTQIEGDCHSYREQRQRGGKEFQAKRLGTLL